MPTNNIANFLNDSGLDTSNILGRVTDGNPSSILGMIKTTGFANANLFLMNPAGILFGPNAQLNVGGAAHFSTANYIKLSDGVRFNAIPDVANDALLSSAPVMAFGFLGSDAASIAITGGTLEVPEGETLSFLGGPVPFTPTVGAAVPTIPGVNMTGGSLAAPSGLIHMATVTSPGEVPLPALSGGPLGNSASSSLSDSTIIRIRSGSFVLDHAFLAVNNGGATAQNAIVVDVQGATTMRNASSILSETSGTGRGSDVRVTAQSLHMDGSFIKSLTDSNGRGGDISIGAHTVGLTNGSQIVSSTAGLGAGGKISVSARDFVTISGFDATGTLTGLDPFGSGFVPSGIFTTSSSSATGGLILITRAQQAVQGPAVTVENGGWIGSIASGSGRSGNILMTDVASLDVSSGGQIGSISGVFDFGSGEIIGTGPGGDITITADDSVRVAGAHLDLFQASSINASTNTVGKGGNIAVTAPRVFVEDAGRITTTTTADGDGGTIHIEAANQLLVSGFSPDIFSNSTILSDTSSTGAGGEIVLSSPSGSIAVENLGLIRSQNTGSQIGGNISLTTIDLTVSGGGGIEANSSGPRGGSGKVTLDVTNGIAFIGGISEAPGPSGDLEHSHVSNTISDLGVLNKENGGIEIKAKEFVLSSEGRIESNTAFAGGGDVSITASESITIFGAPPDQTGTPAPAGIQSSTPIDGGKVGALILKAPSITLKERGLVTSSSGSNSVDAGDIRVIADILTLKDGSQLKSNKVEGTGQAGSILITATDDVRLMDGSSIQSSTTSQLGGSGGSINITSAHSVALNNGSLITANSTGTGNAGNISIDAGQQFEMRDSSIKTEAAQASGGNITIQAIEQILVVDSIISTSVLGGSGDSGNIMIDPMVFVMQNSQILAQAIQGAGGNITITTPLFLADSTSLVSASSQFGLNGTVTIQSPTSNLSGSLGPLASKTQQVQNLLTQRCAALANGQASSFVVAGREQLPADPGGWLTSPLFATGVGLGVKAEGVKAEGGSAGAAPAIMGIAAYDTDRVSLRRLTPAGFLIANFADSEATGCHS